MSNELAEVLGRLPPGVSQAHVARQAQMNHDHLRQLLTGKRKVTEKTLKRIRLACARIRSRATEAPPSHFVLYRALLVRSSLALALDPQWVLAADPAAKSRTPAMRQAAEARWLAQYLMNVSAGFPQYQVALAAGVTRQAISLAVQEVELRRDAGGEFVELLERLESELTGAERDAA